jgi:hypothetical protein
MSGKTLAFSPSMAFYTGAILLFFSILVHSASGAKPDTVESSSCLLDLSRSIRRNMVIESLRQLSLEDLYAEAFQKRLMQPHPTKPGEYVGNNQRALFAPYLRQLISENPRGNVLDVGAGSGEIVEVALKEMKTCHLYLNEPNGRLLDCYRETLARYPQIHLEGVHAKEAQTFSKAEGAQWVRELPALDLVLMIHMVYHLTSEEMEELIATLAPKMAPGSTLFIVYADQENSTTGRAADFYFRKNDPSMSEKIRAAWQWRSRMFKDGELVKTLSERYPELTLQIKSFVTPSRIYARSTADLAVMCYTGELSATETRPIEKIYSSLQFIENHPDQIDLKNEIEGDRQGMVSSAQPQVICQIHRTL